MTALSRTQLRVLRRAAAVGIGAERDGYRPYDGNEDRTARSLVRRGLAEWIPPGTHASLWATESGRRELDRAKGRI